MRTYAAARKGLMDLLGSFSAGRGVYEDTMLKLGQTDYYRHGAAERAAAAALAQDELAGRSNLLGALKGLGPEAEAVAGMARAGQSVDINDVLTGAQDRGFRARAVEQRQSPDIMNALLAASGRNPYLPYAQSGGVVLNKATGANTLTDLGAAQAEAASALAAERKAGADANDALAKQRQFVASGGQLWDLRGGTPVGRAVPEAGGAPGAEAPRELSLPSWLEKEFLRKTGSDPYGKPIVERDEEKFQRFLQWMQADGRQYGNADEALLWWVNNGRPGPTPPALSPGLTRAFEEAGFPQGPSAEPPPPNPVAWPERAVQDLVTPENILHTAKVRGLTPEQVLEHMVRSAAITPAQADALRARLGAP